MLCNVKNAFIAFSDVYKEPNGTTVDIASCIVSCWTEMIGPKDLSSVSVLLSCQTSFNSRRNGMSGSFSGIVEPTYISTRGTSIFVLLFPKEMIVYFVLQMHNRT